LLAVFADEMEVVLLRLSLGDTKAFAVLPDIALFAGHRMGAIILQHGQELDVSQTGHQHIPRFCRIFHSQSSRKPNPLQQRDLPNPFFASAFAL
jgi:hypothetical protein